MGKTRRECLKPNKDGVDRYDWKTKVVGEADKEVQSKKTGVAKTEGVAVQFDSDEVISAPPAGFPEALVLEL